MMHAGAFVRRSGAYNLGHVGWSFQYADTSYYDGGVENPAGEPVAAPGHCGFWTEQVTDPDAAMRLLQYDFFKMFEVPVGDTDDAEKTVAWIGEQPYLVIGRNCMDDTYDVLRAYGVPHLPLPLFEITPNHWFDRLNAQSQPVSADALRQAGMLPATKLMMKPMTKGNQPPVAPAWRTPGHPEWQALQKQILQPSLNSHLALPNP